MPLGDDLTKPQYVIDASPKHWRKKYSASAHRPTPPGTARRLRPLLARRARPAERRKLLASLIDHV